MISLNKSVRTCKVDTGYADRIQSARFQETDLMVCPNWQGVDTPGRWVHPDSFYTKTAGCNLPMDRVAVENFLRPTYMTYINLDASGFKSDLYGEQCQDTDTNMECYEASLRDQQLQQTKRINGHFSEPNGAQLTIRRESFPYEKAMQQEGLDESTYAVSQNTNRQENFNNFAFRSQQMNRSSGMA